MGRLRDPQIRPRLGLQGRPGLCQKRPRQGSPGRWRSSRTYRKTHRFLRRGDPETLAFPFKIIVAFQKSTVPRNGTVLYAPISKQRGRSEKYNRKSLAFAYNKAFLLRNAI